MGHWGYRSYDSDACHDILDRAEDKHNSNAEILEDLLTNYCIAFKMGSKEINHYLTDEMYLGVVVWGLDHRVVVARKPLQHALRCAQTLLKNRGYLRPWKNYRGKCIQGEIKQIQKWLDLSPKELRIQKALGSIC